MMKLISNAILGTFIFVLSSAGVAQDLFEKREPLPFTFLQKIRPDQTVGGYPMLTVGKDWSLYSAKTGKNTLGLPIANISAIDIRDGKFFAMYDMSGNLAEDRSSDWVEEPCKRNDFLYKKGDGFRNVNCVSINHYTKYFQNPSGDGQVYLSQFRDMKLEIPPTIIKITFTRYSDRGRLLMYNISLNPEAFGFERDAEPMWRINSWNKEFINKDSKKVAFIAGLSKWADAVRDKMDAAFDHKADAFLSIPPLESFLKPASI